MVFLCLIWAYSRKSKCLSVLLAWKLKGYHGMMVESFYLIDFVECEMWKVDALCSLETKFADPKILLYVIYLFLGLKR